MLEVEEGPSRRVSRGRKRGSNEELKRNDTEQKGKCLRSSKKSEESNWFGNSFQSNRTSATSPDNFPKKCPTSSTPKAKRSRRFSAEKENLNTSDALFADLDIDTLTSQALSQSQTAGSPSSKNRQSPSSKNRRSTTNCGKAHDNSMCKSLGVEETKDKSLVKNGVVSLQASACESQSQYFVPKFGNYRPSQPIGRKEIIIDNKVISSQGKNDSSFSFSFVGDETQVLDQTVSGNSACDKINQSVFKVTDVGPKDLHVRDKTCSTQNEYSQLKTDQGRHKLRCTPYFKTADLSVSVINTQDLPQAGNQSQFCVSDGTQSKEFAPILDTTQLKDDEGFKYRCTPYKKSKDLCTQTQTQCELMAGTQYQAYLHESYKDSQSQLPLTSCNEQSQIGNRENLGVLSSQFQRDSQLPCTSLCDMTGVIIDSQNKDEETVANTSDCDMFTDSFCDDNSPNKIGDREGKMKCKDLDAGITSHTQSLNCAEASQISQTKKPTLDDDLECMIQESQNLRKTRTKVPMKNQSSDKGFKHETELEKKAGHSELVKNSSIVKEEKGKVSMTSLVQEQCLSYGDKRKSGIQSELRPQSAVGLVPNLPTTPGGAGSLQDRIKKRLKENAGRRTPQGPGVLMEQLREQVLERVHLEAEMMKESSNNDIGPFYGLPTKVKHLFENYRGIKSLYDWQDECLKLPAVLERKNLIYSLPTSGGKTLVAEILILQEILCRKRDALLILPFVSIVQEKVRNMSQFAVDLNFYVEEYAGSKGRFPPIKRRNNHSLYIATIEKAHSLINSLIETDRMDNLGLVVVDELHMLGEGGSRGSTLESTLMKILHSASAAQVIGMSATLNNIKDLQRFLTAEVYCNDFRPVTLTEHVKLTESIYRVDQKAKCPDDQFIHDRIVCFQYPPEMTKTDPDHILGLALEVIPDNSCLVFCPTKKNCENVAQMLSKLMAKYKRELTEVKKKERRTLLKELSNDSEGKICPVLQYTIHFGIAYHHSGLTVDERKLIEEAYSEGILCLLACTSTLAAGVNLPAKRVILRSPYVGQYFISRSQYKQMVGRAGRAGIDTSGESILICKSSDREKVRDLLSGSIESCHSSLLYNEGKGIRTLLLSTIGLKITTTTEDVFKFVTRSLAHCQQSVLGTDVTAVCQNSLQRLIDSGLVLQIKSPSEDPEQTLCHSLEVTRLGKATFKGPIDPDYAEMLYKDLKKAEEPLVISNHLHLLYLVTPYDAVKDITPSWFIYFNQASGTKGKSVYKGRAYQCKRCYKVDRKGRTVAHILKHHIPFDRVPFSCSLCSFRCQDKVTLVKHITQYQRHQEEIQKAGGMVDHSRVLHMSANPRYIVDDDMLLLSREDSCRRFSQKEDPLDDLDGIFEEEEEEPDQLSLPDWIKDAAVTTMPSTQVNPQQTVPTPQYDHPSVFGGSEAQQQQVMYSPPLVRPYTSTVVTTATATISSLGHLFANAHVPQSIGQTFHTRTQPIATQPLLSPPTVTQSLVMQPPVTQPPVSQSLDTQPRTTRPLVTEPSATQPPVTQPLSTICLQDLYPAPQQSSSNLGHFRVKSTVSNTSLNTPLIDERTSPGVMNILPGLLQAPPESDPLVMEIEKARRSEKRANEVEGKSQPQKKAKGEAEVHKCPQPDFTPLVEAMERATKEMVDAMDRGSRALRCHDQTLIKVVESLGRIEQAIERGTEARANAREAEARRSSSGEGRRDYRDPYHNNYNKENAKPPLKSAVTKISRK